jgi:hypothetical protein
MNVLQRLCEDSLAVAWATVLRRVHWLCCDVFVYISTGCQRVLSHQYTGLKAPSIAHLFLEGRGISESLPEKSESIEWSCGATSAEGTSRCTSRGFIHRFGDRLFIIRTDLLMWCGADLCSGPSISMRRCDLVLRSFKHKFGKAHLPDLKN